MSIAIITGANRGIGLELAQQLSKTYEVYALCRQASKELKKEKLTIIEDFDVRSSKSSQRLLDQLGSKKIDLLFNNAGIYEKSSLDDFKVEAFQKSFEVNSIAPIRLSIELLPAMNKNSKIALMSSRMGSIEDNSSGGSYAYRMSKSALNAGGKSLAVDLKDKSIAVALIHPGYVKTDMTSGKGNLSTSESVSGILKVLEALNMKNSGQFWHSNGESLPW